MSTYNYSIYVISALCGNAWRESGINAGRYQVGGTAFGMFQWDGSRRTNLENYLTNRGLSLNNSEGQLDYLVEENDWIGTSGGISSLQDFLNSSSNDIPLLTEAFMKCWERPGKPYLDERINYANTCYEYITEHKDDMAITTWVSLNNYLTQEQTLNNAVLMYRYYSGHEPSPVPPTPTKKKKMPLYMKIRYF